MKYRPSNGSEGEWFMSKFCDRCVYDRRDDDDGGCNIILRTMIHDVDDAEYPKEWTRNDKGEPVCTKFAKELPVEPKQSPKPLPGQKELF